MTRHRVAFLPVAALLLLALAGCCGAEDKGDDDIGDYYGQRYGRNLPEEEDDDEQEEGGGGMSGIGLIFLILFLVALLAGIYFAAWCMCSVQRSRKEGHYILDSEADHHDENEMYNKKLYAGLDMVDEAKETYVKNQLDLDTINESTAPPLPEKSAVSAEPEKPAPSAPEENGGGGGGGGADAGDAGNPEDQV